MPIPTNRRLVELTAHVAEAEKAWRDAAARRLQYIAHLIETGAVRTGYELGCALGLPWQQRAGRAYRLFRDAEALIASRKPQEPQQDTPRLVIDTNGIHDCAGIATDGDASGTWTVGDGSGRIARTITVAHDDV